MEDRGSSSSYTWFYRESWVQGRFTTRAISNGFFWTISRWGILWIFENTNESLCSTIFVSQSWFTWILQTSQMGRCYHSWNEKIHSPVFADRHYPETWDRAILEYKSDNQNPIFQWNNGSKSLSINSRISAFQW